MDRDLILKCSKSIRLEHKLPPEFTSVVVEFCTIKGHPEHISVINQLLYNPTLGGEIVNAILTHFEKEYHIIKLEKFLDKNFTLKQLINIY